MNWNLNWSTIIIALITAIGTWEASKRNSATSRDATAMDHYNDLWERMDKQSKQLDEVIRERNDLRDQVDDLKDQVHAQQVKIDHQSTKIDYQNKLIREMNTSLGKLRKQMEDKK